MSDDTDPRYWATRAKEAESVARATLVTRSRLERRLGRLEGALSLLLDVDGHIGQEQRERLRKLLHEEES